MRLKHYFWTFLHLRVHVLMVNIIKLNFVYEFYVYPLYFLMRIYLSLCVSTSDKRGNNVKLMHILLIWGIIMQGSNIDFIMHLYHICVCVYVFSQFNDMYTWSCSFVFCEQEIWNREHMVFLTKLPRRLLGFYQCGKMSEDSTKKLGNMLSTNLCMCTVSYSYP